MSRMSMLYDELMGQCARLGFQDLGEAEQAGYGVDWQNARLIKVEDEQEKAHEAWLKERDKVVAGLQDCYKHLHGFPPEIYGKLLDAIKFIKEQCHD